MTKLDKLEQRIKELERKMCCKTQFFDTVGDLPAEGNEGVIYVTDDGNIYVWNGVDYVTNGLGDAYYTNSYVERLKALGSDVQYSNYPGGSTASYLLTDNGVSLISVYISKDTTINGAAFIQSFQGDYTADNYNGIGLYSYDESNSKLVLIASTTNDGDIWKAAATTYTTKNFITPVVVNSGIYYVGLLYNRSAEVSPPSLFASATQTTISATLNTAGLTTAKVSGGFVSTHNTLPSEILNTAIASIAIGIIIYLY